MFLLAGNLSVRFALRATVIGATSFFVVAVGIHLCALWRAMPYKVPAPDGASPTRRFLDFISSPSIDDWTGRGYPPSARRHLFWVRVTAVIAGCALAVMLWSIVSTFR